MSTTKTSVLINGGVDSVSAFSCFEMSRRSISTGPSQSRTSTCSNDSGTIRNRNSAWVNTTSLDRSILFKIIRAIVAVGILCIFWQKGHHSKQNKETDINSVQVEEIKMDVNDSILKKGPYVIAYKKIEEQNAKDGLQFQKFIAVKIHDKNDVQQSDERITVHQWVEYMSTERDHNMTTEGSDHIRNLYETLRDVPYDAYFFETPSITSDTYISSNKKDLNSQAINDEQFFEFVVVKSITLDRQASNDPQYHIFEKKCLESEQSNNVEDWKTSNEYCCTFPNLSGDAVLVVPKPLDAVQSDSSNDSTNNNYSHLAMFLRNAPYEQIQSYFRMVVATYEEQIMQQMSRKVWFSTSGLGVSWLHIRFDRYPKYYSYQPYKK